MTRGDRLLIAVLAAACVLTWSLAAVARGEARQIAISSPAGSTSVPVFEDQTIHVQGRAGELVVKIEHGSVRVTDADCPDRICVSTGAVSAPGEVVACVPNGVVLRVEGSGDELDVRVR